MYLRKYLSANLLQIIPNVIYYSSEFHRTNDKVLVMVNVFRGISELFTNQFFSYDSTFKCKYLLVIIDRTCLCT